MEWNPKVLCAHSVVEQVGVLRLRDCFAVRSNLSAQDDSFVPYTFASELRA